MSEVDLGQAREQSTELANAAACTLIKRQGDRLLRASVALGQLADEVERYRRWSTDLAQDNCENAYVEATTHDVLRQALHSVAPDHPALSEPCPSYGVWATQQREIDSMKAYAKLAEEIFREDCAESEAFALLRAIQRGEKNFARAALHTEAESHPQSARVPPA